MSNDVRLSKKTRLLVVEILILAPFVYTEIASKIVNHFRFSDKEKQVLSSRMGFDPNPRMITYYTPHHYMLYVLNPRTLEKKQGPEDSGAGF